MPHRPVSPVAYQVILELGIGQFREFESPRVQTRVNLLGLFLAGCHYSAGDYRWHVPAL